MDPTTLAALYTALYTVIATVGLVATDTYVNARTMYLDTTVADSVRAEGYDPSVVDGIFIAEVKEITKTPSLVAAPQIQSSRTKPISAALAEAASLESALVAIQGVIGIIPPKLVASLIAEDSKQRTQDIPGADGRILEHLVGDESDLKMVLTGYERQSGYFYVTVEGRTADEDVDDLIREAAFRSVLKLDPYLALLYDLKRRAEAGEDLMPSQKLIEKELAGLPDAVTHSHRALVENLNGILALLEQNQPGARKQFGKAIASDPRQPVGYLNLAFLEVHEDHYREAIRRVDQVIYPTYWPMTGNTVLLASAYTIKAVAETELHDYAAAERDFKRAVATNPRSSEVFVYWARMLRKAGRDDEADRKFELARQNSVYFENFPEMALLYFWLTEEGDQPLARRLSVVEAM